jgi:hypothetical protein
MRGRQSGLARDVREWLDRVALVLLGLTAASFAARLWIRARRELGAPVNDVYAWVYPTAVHAWRAIREGDGLLWNPYQDCGQPFFAISQTGLLYPVNFLFFILDREPALLASVFLHLGVAGAGTFLLCRALGAGAPAALCAALTFQLAGSTVQLATWTPIHIGTYSWLPVALWRTEHLVRHPTFRQSVLLALVLTLQLLPGFPQIVFFTYQLIAARIAWSLLTREAHRPAALLAWTGLALVLPLFLAAVQLLPSMEVARESVRALPLSASEIGPGFSWTYLRSNLRAYGGYPGNFLLLVVAMLALLAARRGTLGRHVVFYAAIASVYFVLSLGPGTPLFDLYSRLPLGSAFRGSARLLWVTGFALAVLTGLGTEAVLRPPAGAPSSRLRLAGVTVVMLGAALFQLFTPNGLRWSDAFLALALLAAVLLSFRLRPAPLNAAVFLMVATVAANCLVFGPPLVFSLRQGDLYGAAAPAFAFVRARLTLQDRVHLVGRYGLHPDFALAQKAATLFRVPAIFDYEPLASRSYAEFFTFMRTGRALERLQDWYWVFDKLMPPTLQRPLFDLTAARYVLIDRALDQVPRVLGSGVRLLDEAGYVRVYENEKALARARYVPRIAVVAEGEILPRLAAPDVDLRRITFVGAPPQSGFLGASDDATGSAEIVADGAERVTIRVHAPAPGFLFLADQYFPGWTARVNEREAEILRANHTFRLVEVPAGESEVAFVYRPASFYRGRLISVVTLGVLAALWSFARRGRGAAKSAGRRYGTA